MLVLVGCGDGSNSPDGSLAFDSRCPDPNVAASYPNGRGFCDGNVHYSCDEMQRLIASHDCAPTTCVTFAFPRTIYAGCSVGPTPNPLCPDNFLNGCDGSTPFLCHVNQRLEVAPGFFQCP